VVAELVAICVAIVAGLAEWLHAWRTSRLAALAFGPTARPRPWARLAPAVRTISLTAVAWGLITLLLLAPKVHHLLGKDGAKERHLLLLLDVSPSMRLTDAGPLRKISRRERAQEIIESFLQRVSMDQYKISVLAFFNGVKPVVIDTKDAEVVRHILADLPLYQAFEPGKTKLYDGLKEAAEVARRWGPKSTSLMVLSDGDTESAKGIPTMPASMANVLFVGVGDPRVGSYIAGRQSKQDTSTLRQVAARLRGVYVDGNTKHIPSKILAEMQSKMSEDTFYKIGRREFALVACGVGGFVYALLPLLLHSFGTAWQPGIRHTATVEQPQRDAGRRRYHQRKLPWFKQNTVRS
jgi:Ca-activated chloride channel family protein